MMRCKPKQDQLKLISYQDKPNYKELISRVVNSTINDFIENKVDNKKHKPFPIADTPLRELSVEI